MCCSHTRPEDRAALEAALSRLGVDFDESTEYSLLLYLYALREKNAEVNLTRVDDIPKAIVLHIEDSLAVLPEVNLSSGEFCDIGSGCGVPGVPLALVTGRNAVLLESVKKKSKAVENIVERMSPPSRISCIPLRSEEYALVHKEEFSLVMTRAVAPLPSVMELASPLLALGGYFVAMCGDSSTNNEVAESALCEKLGYSFFSSRTFSIGPSEGRYSRSVFVFKKEFQPSVNLPRRPGMATKRPYR